MEKPREKLKKTLLIVGITGAVYLSFKYLLPLVIPFLVAYAFALALRPSALWVEKKTRVKVRGRVFHIPMALVGGMEILLVMGLAGALVYLGGRRLCLEARLLMDSMPDMISRLDTWLTGNCFWLEGLLHLPQGCMVQLLREMLLGMGRVMRDAAMPFLMVNSMTLLKITIQVLVVTVILFVATVLTLQEMDDLRSRRDGSLFRREFTLLGSRIMSVGTAFLKTQASIMALTMAICIAGFFLLGNPYNILLGIGVGLVDALPVFGTGTVLIPWMVVSAFRGQWLEVAGLLAIYLVCYFLREVMEAKMMGSQVGLSPLETLVSMYAGLQLFGLFGLILGPIGLALIQDMVALYAQEG